MSFFAGRAAQRRSMRRIQDQRWTSLGLEVLEDRRLLSADGIDLDWLASATTVSQFYVDSSRYDPHSILVRYREDTIGAQGRGIPGNSGLAALPDSARTYSVVPGLQRVTLSEQVTVEDALAAYRSDPAVVYAEPNYHVRVDATPNDADFTELWGLNNTGQTGGTFDADIDAPEAWDITTGSGNTIVAVIDTGIDYTHPDLVDNMWVNVAERDGSPFVDDDGNGFVDDIYGYDFANNDPNPMDDHSHGTHVAGTIGAVGNDGSGVVGVNWDVQLMALKFLDSGGGGNIGDAIDALEYAVANGATISNNSWGFNGTFSAALTEAISNARDDGHIFAAAAGNGNFLGIGQNNELAPFLPASIPLDNVVSVAALDHDDQIATFSNFGATSVDLGAPGVGILSTVLDGEYASYSGTSMATPHVAGVLALVRDLHPEWSYSQVIDAVLETVDPVSDLAGTTVMGGRLNAARAVAFSGPEIRVTHGGTILTDGLAHVDLGNTLIDVQLAQQFTIQNVGTEDLSLASAIDLPTGFTLGTPLQATSLAPSQQTTFAVALDAAQLGSYSGVVTIFSNDTDEGAFEINVSGTVSTFDWIDDGDIGFTTSGQWQTWFNEGFANDIHYVSAGTGSTSSTWSFDVTPGRYSVAATWTALPNRATNAPFTISDGALDVASVELNQQLSPDDFTELGANWESLGELSVAGNQLSVRLTDDANGFVIADAIRVERLGDLPPGPELEVWANGIGLESDSDTVLFGDVLFETLAETTFMIRNAGGDDLVLNGPVTLSTGFTLASPPGQLTLASGEQTEFRVRLDTSEIRELTGELTLATNDADESTFQVHLAGSVGSTAIVDNGDERFQSQGDWIHYFGEGRDDDIHYSAAGGGQDVAAWEFDVAPGTYRVATTWSPLVNRATDAPVRVLVDGVESGTYSLNQQNAPDDFTDQDSVWESLGVHSAAGSSLRIELADAANGFVIADAVRIERLDLPPAPEIEVSLNGAILDSGMADIDFGSALIGVPLVESFTITNVGGADLTVDEAVSIPAGFRIAQPLAATTLAPGESMSLDVELAASSIGAFAGEVVIHSDDGDESQYRISVEGSVSTTQIIDNGDTGFQTTASWTGFAGQGFGADIHYAAAGAGDEVASWNFAVAPGVYQLAATWNALPNRATDATYVVQDGSTGVAQITVNQEVAPSDFTADSAGWHSLGVFEIASNGLIVSLDNLADEFVIADAVRVGRVGDLSADADIRVLADDLPIASGSLVDFGNSLVGAPATVTTTIRNVGLGALDLGPVVSVPNGFRIAVPPASSTLATGESTTMVIEFAAAAAGSYGGTISIASNDPDAGSFEMVVSGTATAVQIVDNTDAGFAATPEWIFWPAEGLGGNMHYASPGDGAAVATWTVPVTPGVYDIAVSWSQQPNRATDAPYSVYDDGTLLDSAQVNQELVPSDFSDLGVSWHRIGTYSVLGGEIVVTLGNDANEFVIADAVRVERIADLAEGPDLQVQLDGQVLPDGVGVADFGTTFLDAAVARTFVLRNTGSAELTLGNATVTSGYVVTSQPDLATLAPGQSTTLEVEFLAQAAGANNGTLAVATNMPGDGLFEVSLTASAETARIVDNGDAGFSTSGQWSAWPNEGFANDIHYSAAGSGGDVATWAFEVGPGEYRVAATWNPLPNRATNAPYMLYDGAAAAGSVVVNQQAAPSSYWADGAAWEILGTVSVTGSQLRVQLTDDANLYVIADAIRIEQVTSTATQIAFPEAGDGEQETATALDPTSKLSDRYKSGGLSRQSADDGAAAAWTPSEDDLWLFAAAAAEREGVSRSKFLHSSRRGETSAAEDISEDVLDAVFAEWIRAK